MVCEQTLDERGQLWPNIVEFTSVILVGLHNAPLLLIGHPGQPEGKQPRNHLHGRDREIIVGERTPETLAGTRYTHMPCRSCGVVIACQSTSLRL
jgi:hypothetical protein